MNLLELTYIYEYGCTGIEGEKEVVLGECSGDAFVQKKAEIDHANWLEKNGRGPRGQPTRPIFHWWIRPKNSTPLE